MTGKHVFRAVIDSGIIDVVRNLTAPEKAQAFFAISGGKFHLLPENLREVLEVLARELQE